MLLIDENLSRRIVLALSNEFPGSLHVLDLDLGGASDLKVWEIARERGLAIVSKDNDFRQRAFVHGPPPQVIWLALGNASTDEILAVIRGSASPIRLFIARREAALLVLPVLPR